MATSYFTQNELNKLDNEIFHCINQLKVCKKEQIIKMNDFKEISKDYLLARLITLSNEQKIKIKLFNNFASYSVNEELIDLKTVKTIQYSSKRSSSVPITDTPVCNIIDDSIQDISAVPVVDTPACNNNNSSIQGMTSPLSILRKKVYTNKDRIEHLISSLQDKNKITELNVKGSLLEEENLKLRNQITENHITIGKMQNVSNTVKDSQAKPAELNMTKLVDNGEILTLDNESMSNAPLPKNPICSKSIGEQRTEFRKKIMKNICDIKVIQRKHARMVNPFYYQSVSVKLI